MFSLTHLNNQVHNLIEMSVSWDKLKSLIQENPNRHCSLPLIEKQTMHIIEEKVPWISAGWSILHESMPPHPLSILCALEDPFFRYSNKGTQAATIRTKISSLSQRFDDIYKEKGGRGRKWFKSHFIAWFLKTEAEEVLTWNYDACLTDKLSSAATDFLALSAGITIAVILPEKKQFFCYPTSIPLCEKIICVNESANWIASSKGTTVTPSEFKAMITVTGFKWIAPASVSIPETITELKKSVVGAAGLPTMTKQELKGLIFYQRFISGAAPSIVDELTGAE